MPKAKKPKKLADAQQICEPGDLQVGKQSEELEKLEQAVDQYIDALYSSDYCEDESDDYKNAIFETAAELFYGTDVWKSINERITQLK